MTNPKQTPANCVINDYYHWFLSNFRSILPKDYIIVEIDNEWPRAVHFLANIYGYSRSGNKKLEEYKAKWIKTALPQIFEGRIKREWKICESTLNRDSSYWEYLEKRKLEKLHVKWGDWNGIIKATKGRDSVYFCRAKAITGGRLRLLEYAAYKNKDFLEELLMDLDSLERDQVKVESRKVIFCPNSPSIEMEKVELDRVILPGGLKRDILSSIDTFYKRIDLFKGMGVPSKRGFLLTGEPGNGKTLLCFALAGYVATNHNVRIATLRIDRELCNKTFRRLYEWASVHGPSMVILEDVETILAETQVTRSGFLNVLDGFRPERGVLTLATTNYPEKLDPALAHRPSRFDRVWNIPMPGNSQRAEFIGKLFEVPGLSEKQCEHLVSKTQGWSMAYVQELKATSVVSAVQNNRDYIDMKDIDYAMEKLSQQFRSGIKNHRYENGGDEEFGFSAG